MHKLTIPCCSPRFIQEFAVEAAAVIGFNALSLEFPVLAVQADSAPAAPDASGIVSLGSDAMLTASYTIEEHAGNIAIRLRDENGSADALAAFCARLGRHLDGSPAAPLPIDTTTSKEAPGIMDGGYAPVPAHPGLESLFERGFIVKDTDFDFLPDTIDASIAMPAGCDDHELSAACDLAARLAMESLGLALPMLEGKGRTTGTLISIERDSTCGITIGTVSGRRTIRVAGSGPDLSRMASLLCRRFPEVGSDATWPQICADLQNAATMGSLDGQLAWLDAVGAGRGSVVYCEPEIAARRTAIEAAVPEVSFLNRRDPVMLLDETYELPWELETCRELLSQEIYPRLAMEKPAIIDVVISEDGEIRKALEAEILREALARHVVEPRVRVLCAFKQGFSWIRDYQLPELAAIQDIDSIDIGFSAFLPDGRTAWTDEDGATPKISAQRKDDPDAWLDPPVRLLQELYPIDDILARALSLPRDRIRFSLWEGTTKPAYRIIARSAGGETLHQAAFVPSFSERTYLDAFPGIGKVHPGTGRISLDIPGTGTWTASFSTDMESVWAAYQTRVLPACRTHIEKTCGGTIDAARQPYFSQLRLDIDASEPDETLPVRQDRVSSLESLHEDIYFVGLDYFQTLGLKSCGTGIDAPGLILPVIRKRPGRPRMRFRLLGELSAEPAIDTAGKRFTAPYDRSSVSTWIQALHFDPETGGFSPHIAIEFGNPQPGAGADPVRFINSYARLLTEGLLDASKKLAGTPRLSFSMAGQLVTAVPPESGPIPGPVDISSIDILENSLIGYEEYLKLVNQFSRVPGLRVRQVATSRQGRAIHAIELLPSLPGHVSRTKLIAARPVYYVNARHHANEVSGTNAAFMLLRTLLVDPAWSGIADKVNIIIVPFENADGAAVHYDLAKDNPEWILHIARYNSLGKELAHEYWKDSTIHSEAMAFTKVWRDWLPDIVTDNHGVPTHEWCQQFSGYTSPWFKGFWMPRALLYGYFWYVTDERYAPNKALSEGVQEAVADLIGADPACSALNAEWKDRFETYAHSWMPRLFPAEYHKDMIFYWVPYPYKHNYYYASVKFPWVTATSFVTEVSDETATGDFLRLCAHTHVLNDLAVIRLLADFDPRISSATGTIDGTQRAFRSRIRPPAAKL